MKNKEITKLVNKFNKNNQFPITEADFKLNAKRYIKACKEHRLICSIGSVSSSGMSRTMKFLEMPKNGGYLMNFFNLFEITGHHKVKDSDYFRITGCGMDMVFATNYNLIHEFYWLGFITKKTCDKLAQQTPQVV